MNIFAIYCQVKLTNKPKWFDAFRNKYDLGNDLHITLKQPCYVSKNEELEIREVFSELIFDCSKIFVEFDEINIEKELSGKYCVMLNVRKNVKLVDLQKKLIKKIEKYNSYIEPELELYELNFVPHITIGRDIEEREIGSVKEMLKINESIKGVVRGIVLVFEKKKKESEAIVIKLY